MACRMRISGKSRLRANIREVLESVTLADVVSGVLPESVSVTLSGHPEIWEPH